MSKSKLLHCKCELCGISIITPLKANCCDFCYNMTIGQDISSFSFADWLFLRLENDNLKSKLKRLIGL
jgi:hypothetical protein